MSTPSVSVYTVETPEGRKHFVSLLPQEVVFEQGLDGRVIVGEMLHPWEPDEPITPEVFARNRIFVEFLHDVIRRHVPQQPGFQEEAQRQGDGWVYLLDHRTPTPEDDVPPEDIFGAFQVSEGKSGEYRPNVNHQILTKHGFFQLDPPIFAQLMEELTASES